MRMAMSVRQFFTAILLATCCVAVVADEELPEIELIEYLGLWEESDEEWVMFSDPLQAENKDKERIEPAPEGKESTEKPDES